MNRFVYSFAIAVAALIPVVAVAAPSPTPSPTLDTVLAPPPSGFAELTTSSFHGSFTAHDYATNTGSDKASEIEQTLIHDGYVDGFGKTWIQQSANHAMVELVIAFTGGKGARDWLTQAEAGDKSDPTYVHPDTISGIPNYYGGHFASSTDNTVTDAFVFAKGNDVFEVGAVSQKDDILSLASSQTTSQFNSAPSETIPSSDWPENKTSGSSSGGAVGTIFLVVAAIVVIAIVVLVFMLRSRRRPAPAMYGAMGAPMAGGPMMGGATPPAATSGVQLSDDGKYWWDGQAWKDAEHEAPPSAQRSSDGTLWWDGRNWRPVPQQGPPAS